MDEHERRREQQRQAQARYRKAHADKLRHARHVANILARQTQSHDEVKELATAIRSMTSKDYARALGRELMRHKRKAR